MQIDEFHAPLMEYNIWSIARNSFVQSLHFELALSFFNT